ncbi:MAG TPA: FecR family protein [Puia sp.]|nr:FecR family protein [Puia sp.]
MKESKKIGLFLFLYTRGELSPAEQEELLVWRNQDPENEKLFFQMTDPDSLRKEMQDYYSERDRDFEKLKTRLSFLSGTRLSESMNDNPYNDSDTQLLEDEDEAVFTEDEYASSGLTPVEYWGSMISDPEDIEERKSGTLSNSKVIQMTADSSPVKTIRRGRFLRRLFRVACVIILVIKVQPYLPKSKYAHYKADIFSSDGITMAFNDFLRGFNAGRIGIKIHKTSKGEPIYVVPNEYDAQNSKLYTLRTPLDGLFIVQLPDGTLIWLNGASSITYPANFNQHNITLGMEGEVFVERSKDSSHQYLITASSTVDEASVDEPARVQWPTIPLAPSSRFDINSYSWNNGLFVTLINGKTDANGEQTEKGFHFSNGKQTVITRDSLAYNRDVSISEILAWKNGQFFYREATAKNIMPAIAKWYDMEVDFPMGYPEKKINLQMNRSASITDILDNLKSQGLRITHLGKNITIWK